MGSVRFELAEIQPKGVGDTSWLEKMMTSSTQGAISKATCPRCEELTYSMKEVRPLRRESPAESQDRSDHGRLHRHHPAAFPSRCAIEPSSNALK